MFCDTNKTCISPTTGTAPQTFSSALQFFAAAQCLLNVDYPRDAKVCNYEEFDIIIVGAGTAGCVLASRLSEVLKWTVLIIEAGDDPPVESRIPEMDNSMFNTKYDWRHLTTNDGRIDQAHINGSIAWPRGKMLGGSSNINSMLYLKGVKYDYEEWYKAGNEDWSSDTVKKYFKKAESYQYADLLKNFAVNREYGHNGPLIINKFNTTHWDIYNNIVGSWDELGIKRVIDLNIFETFKSGVAAVTAANGVRQSSDKAYLAPFKNRANLKVLKNAFVTKVLINKSKTTYGVEVERYGKRLKFYARLEVILSAGTINTPQLLMLSGVGPKKHLKSKNILCKVNSPMVGQNLQDHFIVPITIYGNGPSEPDKATQSFSAIQYLYNRTGYLAQNMNSHIAAFYSSSTNLTYPEYQNHMMLLWKNSSDTRRLFSRLFRYEDPVVNSVTELNTNYLLFNFLFTLLHPLSRGNISLNTNDPKDHPLIYPNYFSRHEDLNSAVVGIKILTKITNTRYFKSIGGFLGRIKWPACDGYELDGDDYWKCICINMVATIYHPVGTCKMGPDPKTSVVDSHLRVHGIRNLRVIDASIMPTTTSGNTNGPTGMIGERGADLVKKDHNEL